MPGDRRLFSEDFLCCLSSYKSSNGAREPFIWSSKSKNKTQPEDCQKKARRCGLSKRQTGLGQETLLYLAVGVTEGRRVPSHS